MTRAADLQGKRVMREGGERLGRVEELHVRDGALIALTCGGTGLLQRFMTWRRGHRIAWSDVRRITPDEIVVADRR